MAAIQNIESLPKSRFFYSISFLLLAAKSFVPCLDPCRNSAHQIAAIFVSSRWWGVSIQQIRIKGSGALSTISPPLFCVKEALSQREIDTVEGIFKYSFAILNLSSREHLTFNFGHLFLSSASSGFNFRGSVHNFNGYSITI